MKGGEHLHFGGVDVVELAERFGTPLIVTDEARVRENFRAYKEAFSAFKEEVAVVEDVEICYAVKANWSLAILRILATEGAGADVVSDFELKSAMLAGIPPQKIIFNGNAKSEDELRLAVETGVCVCLDSTDEADALSDVARFSEGERVRVAVRVNPEISVKTHPKIATALKTSKFGIPAEEVFAACSYVERRGLALCGIHCHVGSQIFELSVFREAAEKMLRIASHLQKEFEIDFVDLGGGLGIGYTPSEKKNAPTPKDLAHAFLPAFKSARLREPVKLILEPGRSIVGNASILLTRVQAVKRAAKNFVAVDAGFNILVRPAMYGAYHEILVANKIGVEPTQQYTIVGPLCESGDIFGERRLPPVERGDILAILDVGAYGFSMSSQYNMRPRCAEVLVSNGRAELVRERETFGDFLRHQIIPPRLLGFPCET
ncbi:MAG: diaminopimelate decarboxylase [Candidatus Methanospirare jalkutatii]|nr:diaminopimelate decarboxylase [Candidatus Methanospirare jalkutatii]